MRVPPRFHRRPPRDPKLAGSLVELDDGSRLPANHVEPAHDVPDPDDRPDEHGPSAGRLPDRQEESEKTARNEERIERPERQGPVPDDQAPVSQLSLHLESVS